VKNKQVQYKANVIVHLYLWVLLLYPIEKLNCETSNLLATGNLMYCFTCGLHNITVFF